MKIWQLYEGQTEQIVSLRKKAPVQMFYPASVQDAIKLVSGRTSRFMDDESIIATPSLKSAANLSDVVVQFWTQGRYLEAPREVRRNRQDAEMAQRKYPESFNPLVSFSLLSQRPRAIVKKPPLPDNIDVVYVNTDDDLQKMTPEQFVEWFVKLVRRSRESQQAIESRLNETYIRSKARLLLVS